MAFGEIHPAVIRAGVLGSLWLGLHFILLGGLSDWPRVIGFLVLVALGLMLILKSVVDVLTWLAGLAARHGGMGLGHSVRMIRRLLLRWQSQ